MNENRAYELLTSILSQVSKQDYPEICEYIESSIDREDRSLYDTPFEIACLLHRADSTKIHRFSRTVAVTFSDRLSMPITSGSKSPPTTAPRTQPIAMPGTDNSSASRRSKSFSCRPLMPTVFKSP